jgi:hypothetical protein
MFIVFGFCNIGKLLQAFQQCKQRSHRYSGSEDQPPDMQPQPQPGREDES